MSVLELDGVTKVYQGRVRALAGVSYRVDAGERVGIVGESGSGKTTLARIVLGLTRASSGTVRLMGRDVTGYTREDRHFIHRTAQMVFQDPMSSLNPRKKVRDIIMLPLRAQRVGGRAERLARVRSLMQSVGLPARHLESYPARLSGGQRQRVGIARALAIAPELLLLDEPTASLDVSVQARILELLTGLQRELGVTQVMISHNLGVIRHAADRVAVMYLGQIVEAADVGRLFAAPRHPYTQALLSAVPAVTARERALLPPRVALQGEVASAAQVPPGCPFHPRCPAAFDRCRVEVPGVTALEPRHEVRCHLYEGQGE